MEKGDACCKVCGDKASGKHYGVPSCDGCRGFFKRSIRRGLAYHCKESGNCVVDVTRRNQCQACRFKKCLAVSMKRDAVQHERAPRTPMPPSPCPARRPGFPFSQAGGLVGHAAPMSDLSGYHLIYPQPTLPFSLGLKPPMTLPLGFFNYSGPFSSSLLAHDGSSLLRVPGRCVSSGSSANADVTKPPAQISRTNSVAEDEVTSSEEAGQNQSQNVSDKSKQGTGLTTSLLELPFVQGPESVYECAAKLLFLTVKWARSIPSFLQLSFQDQTLLLEESWSDLFVLSAGEWVLPIDKEYLLSQSLTSTIKRTALARQVHRLQETVARFASMRLDHTEYSCLKALTLFRPETQELDQREHVEALQEQAHAMLQAHCARPDTPPTRFGKLLLLLPTVHTLSKDLLEELLFRKTIGNICIERVLSDMLRSNSGG